MLCLTNQHIMKAYPVLNKVPRHDDVLGAWSCSSTHS